MDLNSPFEKVALIRAKTGQIEIREIKKARIAGASVEMEKIEGGVAIFPTSDVLAILPSLPKGDPPGNAQDVEGVLRLLQTVPPDLMREAGLGAAQISEWEKIKERLLDAKKQQDERDRKEKESKEAETQASLKKEVENWLGQACEFRTPRTEKELTDLKQVGEALAKKSPGHMDVILEALATLSQVQPKEKGEALPDLVKLNENRSPMAPDDLMGWLTGGVLILSFFGLLFGLGFLSSSATRFKEGALLGGIVFAVLGLGLFGLLVWTWLPAGVEGQKIADRVDPKMEELGLYLKNRAKPVYYFPEKQFAFSSEDWRSGVLGYLSVSDESQGMFKVKMKTGSLFLAAHDWAWRQPMTALGIPLPIHLTFEGKIPDLKDWENPEISKVYLGHWSLPDFVGGLLKDSSTGIWRQGLSSAGLAGVKLEKDDRGMMVVRVPAAGVRPKYELPQEEKTKETAPATTRAYKKEISAEALAQAIADRKGKDFLDKFVVVDGEVFSVGGSSFSSSGKMGRDRLKDIYLKGITDFYGSGRHLLIKCQLKGDVVFQMDSRGDLYARIVKQEFEQDKKKAKDRNNPLDQDYKVKFYTLTMQEVSTPDIDPDKETPLIMRGRRIKFTTPQRLELKKQEVIDDIANGGIINRPPGTNQQGEIELYGVVDAISSIVEVDPSP